MQDLLRGVLSGLFDDIRDEETGPSHAGLRSRIYLLLCRACRCSRLAAPLRFVALPRGDRAGLFTSITGFEAPLVEEVRGRRMLVRAILGGARG